MFHLLLLMCSIDVLLMFMFSFEQSCFSVYKWNILFLYYVLCYVDSTYWMLLMSHFMQK